MPLEDNIKEEKQRIRERMWKLLERKDVARFSKPVKGRIPNFKDSEKAAMKLIAHYVFKRARVVFVCPDSPQRTVREYVLRSGKTLVMATPRLREGFLVLTPDFIPRGKEREASTIRGAFRYGRRLDYLDIKVDLKVTGSVAVTVKGARLGKGGGYSDLEYAILRELKVIDERTPVVTTVHDLQIVNELPLEPHDVPLDYIFTPTKIIEVKEPIKEKPKGLIRDLLDERKIQEIPLLKRILAK